MYMIAILEIDPGVIWPRAVITKRPARLQLTPLLRVASVVLTHIVTWDSTRRYFDSHHDLKKKPGTAPTRAVTSRHQYCFKSRRYFNLIFYKNFELKKKKMVLLHVTLSLFLKKITQTIQRYNYFLLWNLFQKNYIVLFLDTHFSGRLNTLLSGLQFHSLIRILKN